MSITFYASRFNSEHGWHEPMERCDCSERWCKACDEAEAKGEDYPPEYSCEACLHKMNCANENGLALLRWLDIEVDWCGTVDAHDLAARCRRRLWPEKRNEDEGIEGYIEKISDGPTVIYGGRRPGYLREKVEFLLVIAERAGDNTVSWG